MKKILVRDVYQLYGTSSISLPEDTHLYETITRFALEPGTRGIFLVDSKQRFTSVITRSDLMKWVHVQFYGGRGRHELSIREFFRIADAQKAKDLISRNQRDIGVNETDTLQTALNHMLDYDEDIIPVLDEENRILGDLRLCEVMLKAIEFAKQGNN